MAFSSQLKLLLNYFQLVDVTIRIILGENLYLFWGNLARDLQLEIEGPYTITEM